MDSLGEKVFHPNGVRWAGIVVYGWFLINLASLLPHMNLLWGPDAVIMRGAGGDGLLENFMYQLVYRPQRATAILALHACSALLAMFSFRWVFIARITVWITGLMLYFAAYPAFNSGFLAMLLFSFFLIPAYARATHPVRIFLTNGMWFVCVVQLVLIYAISAGYKWTGEQWISGSALYYTFSIDHFSRPWISAFLDGNQWLWKCLTWAILLYQSVFPFVAWVKKWRIKLVLTGIVFHLAIATFMGLWMFGFAMIAAYVFLLPEQYFLFRERLKS